MMAPQVIHSPEDLPDTISSTVFLGDQRLEKREIVIGGSRHRAMR